jgi:hypothetical protein
MQVACKAFIVPNPAARSPKERYTHVPRSLRRVHHAKCFNGECPSEATDKIGMRHIYWSCCQNATATQGGWLHHRHGGDRVPQTRATIQMRDAGKKADASPDRLYVGLKMP